jgi:hypothetical protein
MAMRKMNPDFALKIALLAAAFFSFLLSVTLYFQADDVEGRLDGMYVGIWVPSILALGAFILSGNRKDSGKDNE